MKEILFLLFSFLGICVSQAQVQGGIPADSAAKNTKQSLPDSAHREKAAVKIYPNPARNKAILEIRGFEAGLVQVQVVNMNGGVERNDQRLLTSGNENVVLMFSLQAGVYFVVLRQKDQLLKRKLLVQ